MAEPKVTMHFSDANLQRILKKFKKLPDEIKNDVTKVIDDGAKRVKKDARSHIYDADDVVFRYKKKSGRKKAAKGEGEFIAAYHPGNLRKSIRILDKRLKNAKEPSAFVGPMFRRSSFYGEFGKTQRVDPYYFLFYELGTVKIPGADSLGKATRANEQGIKSGLNRAVSKVIEKANK